MAGSTPAVPKVVEIKRSHTLGELRRLVAGTKDAMQSLGLYLARETGPA